MQALVPLLLLMLAGSVHAQTAGSDDPRAANDFLVYHPDMGNRKIAMEAYKRGSFVVAADHFRRAARYADKTSEAALAEMLWKGEGVAMDRPQAYAWMDMAAERGYPSLLALRERYWQQLNPTEQARALEVGQTVYAEYGDSVAKPRLAVQLRRGLLGVTGSHAGYVGTVGTVGALPVRNVISGDRGPPLAFEGEVHAADGNQYYAPQYWKEKEYFASQDALWNAPARHGVVDVGPLQNVRDDKKSATEKPLSHND